MLAFMMRRVVDAELAADLTAETFAAAMLTVRRFDPDRGTASAWLFGIARNVLGRSLARQQVEHRARQKLGIRHLSVTSDALAEIEALESDAHVSSTLADLPPSEASAVRARIIEGKSYPQISQDLRVSPQVVRKRVSRGLARLRARKESV